MIKSLLCLLFGHRTIHKAMTGTFQTKNGFGMDQTGHYYKWERTPFCTRCGKTVHKQVSNNLKEDK